MTSFGDCLQIVCLVTQRLKHLTGTHYLWTGTHGSSQEDSQRRRISICNKVTANPRLRPIRNLTLVSNVCETAPISLFWAPKGV